MPLETTHIFVDQFLRTDAENIEYGSKNVHKIEECGDLEQDSIECLEAYGSRRGLKLCKDFLDDYKECVNEMFQNERINQMRRERIRQVLRGERKPFELLDKIKPPRDSYQKGPFYN